MSMVKCNCSVPSQTVGSEQLRLNYYIMCIVLGGRTDGTGIKKAF